MESPEAERPASNPANLFPPGSKPTSSRRAWMRLLLPGVALTAVLALLALLHSVPLTGPDHFRLASPAIPAS